MVNVCTYHQWNLKIPDALMLPPHREAYIDLMRHEIQGEERIFAALANQYAERKIPILKSVRW